MIFYFFSECKHNHYFSILPEVTQDLLPLLQFCPQVPRSSLCPAIFTILLHWRLCRVLIYEMHSKRPFLWQEWAKISAWMVSSKPRQSPQKSGYTLPCHLALSVTEAYSWSVCWLIWIHATCNYMAHSSRRRRIPRRKRANWCFRAKPQRHFSTITGFPHSTRGCWHYYPLISRGWALSYTADRVKCGRAAPGASIPCSFNKTEKRFTHRPRKSLWHQSMYKKFHDDEGYN